MLWDRRHRETEASSNASHPAVIVDVATIRSVRCLILITSRTLPECYKAASGDNGGVKTGWGQLNVFRMDYNKCPMQTVTSLPSLISSSSLPLTFTSSIIQVTLREKTFNHCSTSNSPAPRGHGAVTKGVGWKLKVGKSQMPTRLDSTSHFHWILFFFFFLLVGGRPALTETQSLVLSSAYS